MPEYRVLVTGSRDWDKPDVVEGALDLCLQAMNQANADRRRAAYDAGRDEDDMPEPYTFTLVHGACPTGADKQADDWAKDKLEVSVERHPAQWNLHQRAAGPIRNQEMVDRGAIVVLGFPKGESKGTRGCIKMAADAGLLVYETEDQG